MSKKTFLFYACAVSAGVVASAGVNAQDDTAYKQAVREYCGDCHNQDDYAGGLDLLIMSPEGTENLDEKTAATAGGIRHTDFGELRH